jgi:hypothetical protein
MSQEFQTPPESPDQEAVTLPLNIIRPDPHQPRRLLPADLADAVAAGKISPFEVIQTWLRRAERDTADVALGHKVQELKRLADSIAQHGLISPISVRPPRPGETLPSGIDYLIVTGERRYWAQVLLVSQARRIHEGEKAQDPGQIKTTVAPPGVTVRAHQIIENLLREDINAVEKARGFWALRYELSGIPYLSGIPHPTPPADDQGEAVGVNHGSPPAMDEVQADLVPWARVEETLGISKRYRIFAVSVLNLDPEALAIVNTHNLAERTIRPIVQKLKNRPDLQVRCLNQVLLWQAENEADDGPGRAIVTSVKELVERLLAGESLEAPAPGKTTRRVSSAPAVRFGGKIRETLDFLDRLKSADRADLTVALGRDEFAEVMIDLRNLRQQIDTILETASRMQAADSKMRPPFEETAAE